MLSGPCSRSRLGHLLIPTPPAPTSITPSGQSCHCCTAAVMLPTLPAVVVLDEENTSALWLQIFTATQQPSPPAAAATSSS